MGRFQTGPTREKEIPMRQALFAVGLIVVLNAVSRGADKPEPRAIIDKAIKALGGADNIKKFQGTKVRTKGRVDAKGGIDFTQELITRLPDEYKESLRLDIGGKTITLVTVFDGKKGWVSTNGNVIDAEGKVLGDMKEAAYMLHI